MRASLLPQERLYAEDTILKCRVHVFNLTQQEVPQGKQPTMCPEREPLLCMSQTSQPPPSRVR